MRHIGLFEGIGGFSYAARLMGWHTIAWCEWNEFGQKVLKHHFPNATGHGDITKTDFTIYRGECDILTGGFPCQPYSQAGKRLGKEDERHLWPEMLRAIREIQPTWVVGENVSGIVNWNGGMVFDEVQADLETAGYEIIPFILPACGVNAPHRRDRVWFIAYSHNARANSGSRINGEWQEENKGRNEQPQFKYRKDGSNEIITNTGLQRSPEHEKQTAGIEQLCESGINPHTPSIECNGNDKHNPGIRGEEQGELGGIHCKEYATDTTSSGRGEIHDNVQRGQSNGYSINPADEQINWANFPTQPPLCGGNDGLSGRLDGITFPKWRTESIKAYGNAIVPQVALQIFKAIQLFQNDISRKV